METSDPSGTNSVSISEEVALDPAAVSDGDDGEVEQIHGVRHARRQLPHAKRQEPIDWTCERNKKN